MLRMLQRPVVYGAVLFLILLAVGYFAGWEDPAVPFGML